MNLKLDENLGANFASLFRDAGHDASTVRDQGMSGVADHELIRTCHREGRGLVTLDTGFANSLVFPPKEYSGIAVLRLRSKLRQTDLFAAASTLLAALKSTSFAGKLWIVELSRIREYQPVDDDD